MMIVWLLIVIAHIHGAPAVATHRFSNQQICNSFAADLKRQQPEIEIAKCIPERLI